MTELENWLKAEESKTKQTSQNVKISAAKVKKYKYAKAMQAWKEK